jgi:hypothetical protein
VFRDSCRDGAQGQKTGTATGADLGVGEDVMVTSGSFGLRDSRETWCFGNGNGDGNERRGALR